MASFWIVASAIFVISLILFWKLSSGPLKKEYGEKLFNNWTSRLYYWQGALYASLGMTFLMLLFLRWVDVVQF